MEMQLKGPGFPLSEVLETADWRKTIAQKRPLTELHGRILLKYTQRATHH